MKLVATLLTTAAIAFSAGACSSKPSAEDCEKAADHVVDLTVAAVTKSTPDAPEEAVAAARKGAEKSRARFVEMCPQVDKGTIDCINGAGTLEDMQKCKPQ
ncbi:MAG: hypothetical protein H6745_16705 [Deltaproteobacteria bacterium]|nr:hypothetical protein [Deltaproteobacteria bacterium]